MILENVGDDLEFFEFEDANEHKETINANDVFNNFNTKEHLARNLNYIRKRKLLTKLKKKNRIF